MENLIALAGLSVDSLTLRDVGLLKPLVESDTDRGISVDLRLTSVGSLSDVVGLILKGMRFVSIIFLMGDITSDQISKLSK